MFEEAGYVVYAAANARQAVAFTIRLLPDVVLIQVDTANTLDVVARLTGGSSTRDIPVVVLTGLAPLVRRAPRARRRRRDPPAAHRRH